jgi:hypothetical protein
MNLDEHLYELGNLLGIASLEFDEQGGAGLYLPGGLEIGLRREDDEVSLTAFAVIRVLPEPDKHALALLRASLLGEHTAGACLSLGLDSQGRDCLVLWRRLTLTSLDTTGFTAELGRLAEAAHAWRSLPLPGDEPDSSDTASEPVPPVAAFFAQRA